MSEKLYKNCPECGKALLKKVAVCPQCGKKQFGAWHHTKKVLGAIFVAFVVFSLVDAFRDNSGALSGKDEASAQQKPATQIPSDQREFVDVLGEYREMFNTAKNNIVKQELRNARANALLKADIEQSVSGWVGEVRSIDVAGDDGVLSVEIADDIYVTTWNNTFSDISDQTLIPRGSEAYMAILDLSRGDEIRFSGKFLPSEEDYFKEGSLTIDGSMRDPEYLFRFNSITPVK